MKLFEPGKIGKLTIKNRIVMESMGIHGMADASGRLSQRAIDFYVARARGGAGLLITGAAGVRQVEKLPYAPLSTSLVVDGRLATSPLGELADAAHDYGAKVAVQVQAGWGRVAGGEVRTRSVPIAPSDQPCFFDPKVMAHGLTIEEITKLINAFEFAAEAVRAAGIDAIEMNCHNGYLVDEFITALWNKRTDKYGGDLDGRLTFLMEIIAKLKKGAGTDFPIIVKYGLTHYLDGGRTIEEGLEIARRLEAAGVAALDIDAGCYETPYWAKPTTYSPPATLVHLAEMVKKTVKIPVIAVGKLGYPELAEKALQSGQADFIGLARPLLSDPDWANKVRLGNTADIRPCLGCHDGCSARTAEGKYLSCTVNPAAGMEREFTIAKAEEKKNVVVIGGGPGGMEAARVAALRGHKVTLYEKSVVLGGSLIPASAPDFKTDYRSLIDYQSTQVKKLGVTIKLGKEATPEIVEKMKPDIVFVATGSTSFIPDIPGTKRDSVVTAVAILTGKKETGQNVVVLGGGNVGCETALFMAKKGKQVSVIARHGLAKGTYHANRLHLLKLLAETGVKTFTNTNIQEITDTGVVTVNEQGQRSILACDTVVLALGARPDTSLFEALKDKFPEVYAIGDCVEPRKVMNAIWEGFRLARRV
ncbi:MAG: FAD-dependent oxidoreductase [Dehalococcoidales bacterium]|nr:FAD-dependent oxidoreductase [Dehalococcoidales bacterium]